MDFALTEEQSAIFDMARDFGQEHIAPHARTWEAEGTIPKELWPKLAELGFGGLYVSEDRGGSGLSRLDATLVFEALSHVLRLGRGVPVDPQHVRAHDRQLTASDDLKARMLPKALSMETVLSYCLTEPGSGSDAAALKTRAERDQRRLSPDGHQGLHLRRRLFRRLYRAWRAPARTAPRASAPS